MDKQRPLLIIIPGIGDDTPVYQQFARRWQRLGYEAHVVSFNWVHITAPLQPTMRAFLRQLKQFGDRPLYLIGISAGGTAAVNALALQPTVRKVITVGSPLRAMPGLRNPLLIESIKSVEANLVTFTDEQKQRILSVHALYDQVVSTDLSKAEGVPAKTVPSIIHAPTIYVALTLYARQLRRFLRS